jgi:hypothetical protein
MIPLDNPQWAELTHAYGPATDIPPFLRSIAADPAASSPTGRPWFELWSALCHQGDVYPASFAAVPHIINILSECLHSACFDFFLLPASIELSRHEHEVTVPNTLSTAYYQALARIPYVVSAVSTRSWDATFCRSVLAATAVGKQQHAIAKLLIQIDESDISEVLHWYFSR